MQLPRMDMDTRVILNSFGLFHLARILANPKTRHLAPAFKAAQNQLHSKMEAREKMAGEEQNALAIMIHQDQEMDEGVKNFERDLLRQVSDNRKEPLFLKYFPQGLRHITAAAYPKEAMLVDQLINALEKETAGKLKKGHLAALKALLKEYKQAMEDHKKAEENEKNARSEERIEKLEWRTTYKKQEAELYLIFVNNKKMVDSFFKKVDKKKKKEADGETEDGGDGVADGGGDGEK